MHPMKIPMDPFGIASSFMKVHEAWLRNGAELAGTLSRLNADIQSAGGEELAAFLDNKGPNGSQKDPEAAFLGVVKNYSKLLKKVHSAYSNWLRDYVSKAQGVPDKDRNRSIFWVNQIINALSPSNYFWTNPAVVQKFMRSKGESAISGYENWLEDVQRGDSMVRIADSDVFKVGENIATTPGFVVFRNRLMELIQYSPKTETAFSTPIVFIQPWINKYYIFDLSEDKSLVSYLVNQGFTVFIVSWKNPSPEMRDVTFEDYMLRGALKAVEVAREICGAGQVHAVGYCIGGTALAALMAWLNRGPTGNGQVPIRDFTLLATMVDYSSPGELDVFISEDTIKMIEEVIKRDGYLDKKYMAIAFRLLRSNSLIWRYYVHNYLHGEEPPKSDFLYWNSDSTRLPAAMCSFYLREFYMKNSLVKEDEVVVANRPLDLRRITQPLYAVGAEQDHICPWTETFKTCKLVQGPVRYTLSDEGHITGMVNPPSTRSRRKRWTGEVTDSLQPDEWLLALRAQQGSWWPDWVGWLTEQCGSRGEPPPMGSKKYPLLEKAPGSYVLEQ